MTIVQAPTLNKYTLTGSIGDIIISTNTDVIIRTNIVNGSNYQNILEERYTPDANNQVILYDLDKIIEQYLYPETEHAELYSHNNLTAYIQLSVNNGDVTLYHYFYVVKGSGISFYGAEQEMFFKDNFLSLLKNKKKTVPGQIEYISWLSSEQSGSFYLEYVTLDGIVLRKLIHIFSAWIGKRNVITYAIDLYALELDPNEIIQYTFVHMSGGNEKRFVFDVDMNYYDNQQFFGFENRFGVPENCIFTGLSEIDNDMENMKNVVTVSGKRRIGYAENKWTVNTGIQPSNQQAYWLYGFFESLRTWIRLNDEKQNIVIDEPTLVYNPKLATSRNFTFSYKYALEKQNLDRRFYSEMFIVDNNDNRIIDNQNNFITT